MDLLIRIALVVFAAWVVWSLCQPRCVFIIRIVQGVPRASKGVVSQAFLEEVREMIRRQGIERGVVYGDVRGQRLGLAFSRNIPIGGQQQLRNWWALSGWSMRPRRA